MKRFGLLAALLVMALLIFAGTFSRADEQTKKQEQEEIRKMEMEVQRLTYQADQMADQLKALKARAENMGNNTIGLSDNRMR